MTGAEIRETRGDKSVLQVRFRDYAQLVRLPGVFTAAADIVLGALCAWSSGAWPSGTALVVLLLASACLYSSGMAWNDFFDVAQDSHERPFRPIPSGRISRKAAGIFAAVLQTMALGFAAAAGLVVPGPGWIPPAFAAALVVAILAYDGWLKRTPAGPPAMGTCRFLNVLLGFCIADAETFPWESRLYLALVVGCYITGVTWFARAEARTSNPSVLLGAAGVMLVALVLALAAPRLAVPAHPSFVFPYLTVALAFYIGFPIAAAIKRPRPTEVQKAVRSCLIGLVVLDTILATAVAGLTGLLILLLIAPVIYFGRWLYTT
jgi:4-hydroxybenzoate polyprenyltransferase